MLVAVRWAARVLLLGHFSPCISLCMLVTKFSRVIEPRCLDMAVRYTLPCSLGGLSPVAQSRELGTRNQEPILGEPKDNISDLRPGATLLTKSRIRMVIDIKANEFLVMIRVRYQKHKISIYPKRCKSSIDGL